MRLGNVNLEGRQKVRAFPLGQSGLIPELAGRSVHWDLGVDIQQC